MSNSNVKVLSKSLSISYLIEGHDCDITLSDSTSEDGYAKIKINSDEIEDGFGFTFNDKQEIKQFVKDLDFIVEDKVGQARTGKVRHANRFHLACFVELLECTPCTINITVRLVNKV